MILYISQRSDFDIGSVTHLKALKDIYGQDKVFYVDLRPKGPERKKNYIAYGKYKNQLERIKRIIQGNTRYIDNRIISDICRIIKQYDVKLIFTEESTLGSLMKKVKHNYPHIKVIVFYHDIGADLFRQWIKHSAFTGKIENLISIRQEKVSQKYCDYNWVFHESDSEKLVKFYGKIPDAIIPLASPIPVEVSCQKDMVSVRRETVKKILFVGSSYYPNVLGIRWFVNSVLPKLSDNIKINIVGRGLESLKNEFTDCRVNVIGTVDSPIPYYLDADIFIAPIFDGGGMKVKTIEAISFAKCFVGTEESLHGFWERMDDSVQNRIVFQCNTAEEWVRILNRLADSEIRKTYKELFDVFVHHFSYETMLQLFKKELSCENG